jgi:hypothetical protein
MKRQSLTPAVFVIVLATGGLPAAAQSTNTNDGAAPVEVTPYASLGSYPSPRFGGAVAFDDRDPRVLQMANVDHESTRH